MAKIAWDETGKRLYETGVDRGVIYTLDETGAYKGGAEAWNGLTAVNHNPSGAEATPLYADNIKYLELTSAEEFGYTIEAYTYPDAFAACNGEAELVPGVKAAQQARKAFGLSHRTLLGNDVKNTDYGYKLHLIYGSKAAPSAKDYATVNDNPEAITMSWECTTTPVAVPNFKPTAHIEIDSTKVDAEKLKALEDILYGTESGEAYLPLPEEVISILSA